MGTNDAMTTPDGVLWDYEAHTEAKHRLLVRYLQAWLPIMAKRNRRLNLIDGFAGPGRYNGGEPGSPLLMLDAYLGHRARAAMDPVDLYYDFIEVDRRRVDHLNGELAALALPPNVHAEVLQGSFDAVMSKVLDAIPEGHALVPTFAFIDPFGYTDHGFPLTSRILEFRKCEVLIYIPLPFIARFVNEDDVAPAITNLFGDESWTSARAERGKGAARILHDVFLAKVRAAAGYAASFEVDASAGRGWSGYTLFFGTGSLIGLERMKEAMWSVDPLAGAGFAYSSDPDQMTIFDQAPDLSRLEASLRAKFGTGPFSIEAAARHTLVSTAFAPRIHLKARTLRVAEAAGRLTASHPTNARRRRGTYPDGTVLHFSPLGTDAR